MLLALDIGNSYIKVGLFDGDALLATRRIKTVLKGGPRLLGAGSSTGSAAVSAVAAASVVPRVDSEIVELCEQLFGVTPWFVRPESAAATVTYNPPHSLGADRLANAVAAYETVRGPAVVVDCGTAIKVEAVGADGTYLGGAIAPGLRTSAAALYARAEKLRSVPLEPPPRAIGRSTPEALRSGLLLGFAGLIDGLVERFRQELGSQAPVIATGGDAPLLAPLTGSLSRIEPDLTLVGIRLLWERRNSGVQAIENRKSKIENRK